MPSSGPPTETTPLTGSSAASSSMSALGFVSLFASMYMAYVVISSALAVEPFIPFLYHPIFQVLSFFFATVSILVLQPTVTPAQKEKGQMAHASFMMLSLLCLFAGVGGIEYNKYIHNGLHFVSPHGTSGIIVSAWYIFQYAGGFTMLNTPAVYGGVNKAKAIWKYHRSSGYVLYLGMLSAVIGSSGTDFVASNNMLPITPLAVSSLLVVIGVLSGIRKAKLGL